MLDLLGQLNRILIREGEREGEVSRLRLCIGEHVGELEDKLVISVEESGRFGHYAPPLLLVSWHHPECRLQPLVV